MEPTESTMHGIRPWSLLTFFFQAFIYIYTYGVINFTYKWDRMVCIVLYVNFQLTYRKYSYFSKQFLKLMRVTFFFFHLSYCYIGMQSPPISSAKTLISSYIALTYHLYLCGQQSLVFMFSPPFSSDPLYSDRHATIYI